MRRRVVLLALAALCLGAAPPADGPKPTPPPPKKAPTEVEKLRIWAQHVDYDAAAGKFAFTGSVTVLKGDLLVNCKQMDGMLDPKTRQFAKVTAVGDVEMVTVVSLKMGEDGRPAADSIAPDAWRASCTTADYDLRQGRLIMSGAEGKPRPRLWRAKGYGEADTIIFMPDKGEYELIGNPVIRGEIPTGPAGKSVLPDFPTEKPKAKGSS